MGSYTNYVDTKGGGGVKEMSTFVYMGGRGGLVKSLCSFLNPIFSKNYTFAKVDWIISLYILARDPFKSSYTKKDANETRLYKSLQWSLPKQIHRIYDSSNAWQELNIPPVWNFQRLVTDFEDGINLETIQNGLY